MTGLREKIARAVYDSEACEDILTPRAPWSALGDDEARELYLHTADAILAIPEIKEALETKRELDEWRRAIKEMTARDDELGL